MPCGFLSQFAFGVGGVATLIIVRSRANPTPNAAKSKSPSATLVSTVPGPPDVRTIDPVADIKYGFARPEFVGFKDIEDFPDLKPFEHHIFVIEPSNSHDAWQKKWDEGDGIPSILATLVKSLPSKVRVTAAEASEEDQISDLLVFPQGIRVRGATVANVDAVCKYLFNSNDDVKTKVMPADCHFSQIMSPVDPYRQPGKQGIAHIFVCCHTKRDLRCGVVGPHLVKHLQSILTKNNIKGTVRGCSHVGGHKYAGNVVIITKTQTDTCQADWYGYVGMENAEEIVVSQVVEGKIFYKFWRGQMSLSKDQMKTQATAAEK